MRTDANYKLHGHRFRRPAAPRYGGLCSGQTDRCPAMDGL